MGKESKIGYVCDDFTTIKLKSVLLKNDAGDWGSNPDENAIGIIRSTNFNNNGILDLTDVAYRTLSPKKKEEKKLYVGDILIERSGGSDAQPVGRVGLITEHMLNEDFAFANFIQRISVKKDILLPQYLYYCLQQMYEMGITASMQAQTTGIRNLDWKQYVKTILPKPSLSEQSAIAKILSTVDEAIRSTRETISKLERVKKALMQNLLSGKMKPDGTLRPAAEFYEDEKMGLVPKGWKSVKFGDRVKILYGKNQSSVKSENGNIPVLGTGGLIEYANEPLCSHPSIIIGRKGTIDKPYYLSQPFWCVDTAYYVDEFIEGDMKYLLYVLQRMNLKSLNEATGVPSLTKRTLYRQRIVLPTKEEQIIIVSKIEEIESSIQQKQEKITSLELLKKSLMQQLLTGRVRVNEQCTINNEQLRKGENNGYK